jgi:Flp pilus assembly protein CpaB
MRRVGGVLIILGVTFAIIAGIILFALYPQQSAPAPEPTVDVVVAFQNIPQYTEIGPGQVGTVSWPQRIPTPIGAFAQPGDTVGKLTQAPIYPGQPVVQQLLVDKSQLKETHSNASLILDSGTLAIALPVSTNTNVAEAVEPGDRVDLVATFRITGTQTSQSSSEIVVTQRLLQDVLVLEVGTWPRPGPPQQAPAVSPVGAGTAPQINTTTTTTTSNPAPVVVTLELSMQDVLVLKNMEANASDFTLALRPANDHALANPTPVTLDYLQQRFNFRLSDLGR